MCVIFAEGLSNVACMLWARRRNVVREWVIGIAMAVDVALLTGPGSAADFPDGEYFVFAQIDAGIEKPVLPSGRARIGLAAGT